MLIEDLKNSGKVAHLQVPVAITASGNGTGVDCAEVGTRVCTAILNGGAVSGTSPTLDVKIQESSDNSTFTDCVKPDGSTTAAFTQVAAANALEVMTFVAHKRYIRCVKTIGGSSTPTVTAGVILLGQKKNPGGSNIGGWVNESGGSIG